MRNKTRRNKPRINKTKKEKISMKDDFYNFYNYKWIKNYQIPKSQNSINLFSILQKKVDYQLLDLIQKVAKHPKNNEEKNMSYLYQSCVNENKELAKKQLYYFVETLNDIMSKNDLYEFIHWFYTSGFNFVFDINITSNILNTQENLFVINSGIFTFQNKNMYKNKNYKKNFLIFLQTIFVFVFGKDHTYNIHNIWKIEEEMTKYLHSPEETNVIENNLHFYSTHSFKSTFHIDISKIFSFLKINYNRKIQVTNPKYLKKIGSMLKHWNSPEWKEYWIYQIIKVYSTMNKNLNHIFFSFFHVLLEGKSKDFPKKIKCLNVINDYMNIHFNKLYLSKYKNEKEIVFCKSLVEKIKNVFTKRLKENKWLGKDTIEKALKKLNKVKFVIGHKTKWSEENYYSKIVFSPTDYYGNYKKYIEILLSRIKIELDEKQDLTIWKNNGINLYDVNAFYNGHTNELTIPNAYLQPPFVDLSKSFEYNLAHVGTTLGHELIHAFDDEGCKLDEKGNYHNWWTKKDKEEYIKKQKMIVTQYEEMSKKDNVSLNGNLVLGENIADIYGFGICEEVLHDELVKKNILGEDQRKYFKDFFENYCYSWKSKLNNTHFKNVLMNDVHSLAKYRVNGVLMNSKYFQRIYSFEESDSMYNNFFIDIW